MDVTLVVLDCDGVMIDSREANVGYYNQVMNGLGRPCLTPDEEEWVHMLTNEEALARLLPGQDSLRRKLLTDFKDEDYEAYNRLLRPEPSLAPFMAWYKARGGCLAVCTNRTQSALQMVLDLFQWAGWFDFVATADAVTNPKPDPEPVRLVLQNLKKNPGSCLYVGDSLADQHASQGAGVPFVAFRAPQLAASAHVDNFEDLKKIIAGQSTLIL